MYWPRNIEQPSYTVTIFGLNCPWGFHDTLLLLRRNTIFSSCRTGSTVGVGTVHAGSPGMGITLVRNRGNEEV